MNIQLAPKKALVGASTQGIGLAIAKELADCGASVTLMARNEIKLREALKSLPVVTDSQEHQYIVADFSDFGSYQSIITNYFRDNTVDILVNNTNGPEPGKALEMDMHSYQQAFDLVFKVACQTTLLALPYMIEKQKGRVINVASVSIKEPVEGLALSNSMRTALMAWSKTLSTEVAPYNITVNNIMTGYFDTERISSIISREAEKSETSASELRKRKEMEVPMGRLGMPEEYGYLAAFIASDYAAYLTGANIPLDGGLTKSY